MTGSVLFDTLLYLIVVGLILYVCWWGLGQLALPEPIGKIAKAILVIITVVVLVDLLLGFTSHGAFIHLR